jgi:hypothetical protein
MNTTYKVTAKTGYQGHAEGETFEADLSPEQEARAKARGSIRVVKRDSENGNDNEQEGGTSDA